MTFDDVVLDDLRGLLDRVGDPAPGDDTMLDAVVAAGSPSDGSAEVGSAGPEVGTVDHDRIRAADPLALDETFRTLVAVDLAGDVDTVRSWLLAAAARGRPDLGVEEATAALRDAGMLLAALRRAGLEPVAEVPQMEPLLVAWGRTTGMVPRDTVVHYGLWNPTGERERRFVDEGPQESALIDSVRRSCRLLPLAGAALDLAWHHDLTSAIGLAALRVMSDAVTEFAAVFRRTRDIVTPQFFAQQLRPFFDPFTVAGGTYDGPAAAFIPLYLVDELLWGGGEELAVVHREALTYARPLWRRARTRITDHEPVAVELERRAGAGEDVGEALEVTEGAVRALLRFRGQHVTTARRAYAYELTRYRQGSGGFAPDELKTVADEERDAATVLGEARRQASDRRSGGWAT